MAQFFLLAVTAAVALTTTTTQAATTERRATWSTPAEVQISVGGKDAQTLRSEIAKAARFVCAEELRSSIFERELYGRCVHDTEHNARKEAEVRMAAGNRGESVIRVAAVE